MLVVQHIWSRWTKASRGAAAQRPRGKPAYPLPLAAISTRPADTAVHEVKLMEAGGFEEAERFRAVAELADLAEPGQTAPNSAANLRWRPLAGGAFGLSISAPWEGMRVTDWPGHLPSPLITLEVGESCVIDWNGRFRTSMFGSNRSYFYEQHRYACAVVDGRPERELFLSLKPRKTFDFTTRIY